MKIAGGIVSVITALALAVILAAAGLAACLAPPVTHALSSAFAQDSVSPFTRTQLTQVADATRDYSFGAHDATALYRVIYDVNMEYRQLMLSRGATMPADFPKVDKVTSSSSLNELRAAFDGASELYCYSPATLSHLDDCHAIVAVAFPVSVVAIAMFIVGLVFVGVTCRKQRVGGVLMGAGICVLALLVAAAIWAIVDFNGLFTAFHGLLFSQGNWTFPYDSLLICALPTPFWMGMGVIWVLVSVLLSAIVILVGVKIRKRR